MKTDHKRTSLYERRRRAQRYLCKLPPAIAGQRGHDATFHAACALVQKFALPVDVAHSLLLSEYNPRCQPPWSSAELLHKITDAALGCQGSVISEVYGSKVVARADCAPASAKWPSQDERLRKQIIDKGLDLTGLVARSRVQLDENGHQFAGSILEFLFRSRSCLNPLVCVAKTKADATTSPLSTWLENPVLSSYSLIVPSPMSAVEGLTKASRPSQRCLNNTGSRRYLVIEFDHGSPDEQAALLWHLGEFGCLTMVVHSGNKSLHGWFLCRGEAEIQLKRFMDYAVRLGADRSLWTPCQLVRLPFGMRENGARQRVLYLNLAPILDREVCRGF